MAAVGEPVSKFLEEGGGLFGDDIASESLLELVDAKYWHSWARESFGKVNVGLKLVRSY